MGRSDRVVCGHFGEGWDALSHRVVTMVVNDCKEKRTHKAQLLVLCLMDWQSFRVTSRRIKYSPQQKALSANASIFAGGVL